MKEKGIKELSEVGFYGLTYKEDVDDTRESPTLQLIESMEKHLAKGARFYDPMVEKTIVENQYLDFDDFLDGIKLIVIMVGHSHIKEKTELLEGITVYDTRNCLHTDDIIKL